MPSLTVTSIFLISPDKRQAIALRSCSWWFPLGGPMNFSIGKKKPRWKKNGGWKMNFLLGWPIFRGYVSGRVSVWLVFGYPQKSGWKGCGGSRVLISKLLFSCTNLKQGDYGWVLRLEWRWTQIYIVKECPCRISQNFPSVKVFKVGGDLNCINYIKWWEYVSVDGDIVANPLPRITDIPYK